MKEKYYIPEIEELVVGLECVWTTLENSWMDQGGFLSPENHSEDDLKIGELELEDLKELIRLFNTDAPAQVRVKYLDKEDIESLGFEIWKSSDQDKGYSVVMGTKEKHNLSYYPDNTITIFTKKPFSIYGTKDFVDDILCKRQKVKNKTELKRLLKQLNINE